MSDLRLSDADEVLLESLVLSAADNVAKAESSKRANHAPTRRRAYVETDTDNVYLGTGSQWVDVSENTGILSALFAGGDLTANSIDSGSVTTDSASVTNQVDAGSVNTGDATIDGDTAGLSVSEGRTSELSVHNGNNVEVGGSTIQTIFDVVDSVHILNGAIIGPTPDQLTVTFEGGATHQIYSQQARGELLGEGDTIGILPVPQTTNVTKLTFRNQNNNPKDYGWEVLTV